MQLGFDQTSHNLQKEEKKSLVSKPDSQVSNSDSQVQTTINTKTYSREQHTK